MKVTYSLLVLLAAGASAQTADTWTQLYPSNSPSQRSAHAMAYDSAHGLTVLFGGSHNGVLGDTWTWNGSNWTQQSPATSPPARESHAMAYDSAHGEVVLFGGFDGNSPLNDTWVWNGTTWVQQFPFNSPPARDSFAMAYDSVRGQVVLFGGESGLNIFSDTWAWDGSNWTQESPQTVPMERGNQAMAFDSTHAQIVMFGGFAGNPTSLLSDTWLWDGSNWTKATPQSTPPAREYQAMDYDSVNDQVVMFGGEPNSGNPLTDTWLWDGTNWNEAETYSAPIDRVASAMAYDAAHNQSVLFGGNAPTMAPDTWLWFGGAPAPPPPPPPPAPVLPAITNVVSASAFGGFASAAPGSWIEIYGSNLSADTRGWTGSDFNGNNAPTALDQVSVSIGTEPAFIDYISPTQVNAQVPSNVATGGPLQLTVTNANGTSAPVNLTMNAAAPGLLASTPFNIGGDQYVVALLTDGDYALPSGSIPESAPVQPCPERRWSFTESALVR